MTITIDLILIFLPIITVLSFRYLDKACKFEKNDLNQFWIVGVIADIVDSKDKIKELKYGKVNTFIFWLAPAVFIILLSVRYNKFKSVSFLGIF